MDTSQLCIPAKRFLAIAYDVIAELEHAIHSGGSDLEGYPNAAIALRNVKSWRDIVLSGDRRAPVGPGFGIGKSDLLFGKVEDRMYELEQIFFNEIKV